MDENKWLRVYSKQSTFKGATEDDRYYSATRIDGASVICVFKCEVPKDMGKAFEISDIKGNSRYKEVVVKGETYHNYTYYIESCQFRNIPAIELSI